jgi:hypothetical protein
MARVLLLSASVWLLACGRPDGRAAAGNLLHGLAPIEASGVAHPERLTDGVVPRSGDPWLTSLSTVFQHPRAYVLYDLGATRAITALHVQGDNNDRFLVELSNDARSFELLWEAPAVTGAGMRPRSIAALSGKGRYLRLRARGGDPAVSAGELLAFSRTPAPFPPALEHRAGDSPHRVLELAVLSIGGALALLVLLAWRRTPIYALAAGTLPLLYVLWRSGAILVAGWPLPFDTVCLVRGVLGAVGVCAVLMLGLRAARARIVLPVLGLLAVLGVAAFYNFGQPQFYDVERGRGTPVHQYDMRVYFPVAKYFVELGFEGLYLASIESYLEIKRLPDHAVQDVELRDLRNNQMVRARNVMADVHAVRQRFSPERWQAFVTDMRYFVSSMGPGHYLGSLRDHGGNATPVWLALAHLLFRSTVASEPTLLWAGLLDPLLLLLAFVCIGRSFGLRTMLVCVLVFGATDFPMFGSNWAGATLRFDWMATLALGACALRTGRYVLGGALLAHASLARAFPALGLLCLPLPALWYAVDALRARKSLSWSGFLREHRWLTRSMTGAIACTALLVALSSTLFGFSEAWLGWAHKISIHTEKANTNHLGVRTVMAFDPDLISSRVVRPDLPEPWRPWQDGQISTYERRAPLALLLRLLLLGACVLACRRARPEHAVLLGTLLIPVFFYPANYYFHYVFVLPLLAASQSERVRTAIEVVLLVMCPLQYFTLAQAVDVRFFWEAVILLVGYGLLLALLALPGGSRDPHAPSAKPLGPHPPARSLRSAS